VVPPPIKVTAASNASRLTRITTPPPFSAKHPESNETNARDHRSGIAQFIGSGFGLSERAESGHCVVKQQSRPKGKTCLNASSDKTRHTVHALEYMIEKLRLCAQSVRPGGLMPQTGAILLLKAKSLARLPRC
jgi:hypothetical protein